MRISLSILTFFLCLSTNVQATTPCWRAIQTMEGEEGFKECARLGKAGGESGAAYRAEKAAIQGGAAGQALLGTLYATGEGIPKNLRKGFGWAKKAADQGHKFGQLLLAAYYRKGWSVPQDYTKAAHWLTKAAEQGQAFAQFQLGQAYIRGQGVSRNFTKALEWLRKGARQGEAEAYGPLALLYLEGKGTEIDEIEARYWKDKLASTANWTALNNQALRIADDPYDKFAWSTKNGALARDLMLRAAVKSPSKGPMGGAPETTLGWWYLAGKHQPVVPIDDEKARYWNSLGAMDDHPNALVNLGLMYATGIGVDQDYGQMALLHLRAFDVFKKEHEKFLEEPDDWPEFNRAEVPPRFMEAHKLYFEARTETKELRISALQARLVREPPKSIVWGSCQLETGRYDANGYWVDHNGQVSAVGFRGAAEECLRLGQIPKSVYNRFLGRGNATDRNEARKIKLAFTLKHSELFPKFEEFAKAYCRRIAANSPPPHAERKICVSRGFASPEIVEYIDELSK